MKIAKAILIKKETADQLVTAKEHVQIGKEYLVDLDTRRMTKGFNYKKQMFWEREIINMAGDDKGWWPTEMLQIETGERA